MIESISISGVATYDEVTPEVLKDLKKINFIYGSNGTGKTTIGRVIAEENNFLSCSVKWIGGVKLHPFVYNKDFVEKNFNQELKGVFTLGEGNIEAIKQLDLAKERCDKLKSELKGLNVVLEGEEGIGGKKNELSSLEEKFKELCWTAFTKHKNKFSSAFEGFRDKKEKFKSKVLIENTDNSAELLSLNDLEKKAEVIFGPIPVLEPLLPSIESEKIIFHESNQILKKRVIGKDDVDIAAMIKKLGNSDWVREGKTFYVQNDNTCPFCQQSTQESFAKSLNEYFDEAFEADSKAIDDLVTNYKTDSLRLQQQIVLILSNPSKFLNSEKLQLEKDLLDSIVRNNQQKIELKKKESSQPIELGSIRNVIKEIEKLIADSNGTILEHNKMVNNLFQEKKTLISQVWKFLLEEELKSDLSSYKTAKDVLTNVISVIEEKILLKKQEIAKETQAIQSLEKQITSIQPTIDEINRILELFGFHSFKIGRAESEAHYKLIRPDGNDAKLTLSEGEKTFITFLYFYHLMRGSDSSSGTTTERVIVFDDPVSSLDSDILFVVSSLIRNLFAEVGKDKNQIRQIFILTHNVYFHKEVSFCKRGSKWSENDATFWIVRKLNTKSKIEKHETNPITTSYNLLWAEIKKPSKDNLTVQNVMRRILESYFKILGEVDLDGLCEKFEGNEKIICQSLISWIHDGSHNAHDDVYITLGDVAIESYQKVFRSIFVKMHHENHYKMMIGDLT